MGDKLASSQKLWHWLNIVFFSIASLAATVAGIRLIVVDSRTYHPLVVFRTINSICGPCTGSCTTCKISEANIIMDNLLTKIRVKCGASNTITS
ncbi:unnamed protein product [Lupinus luteus]|uniref:Uncharacterized protein n=1 Tax=Lupinus luteus TaxID=3873 RepID=A0AAV1VX36_LUPLU